MSEMILRNEAIDNSALEKEVMDYLDATGITSKLLENEKKMFLNIAKAFQLSPFKRELHITAFGSGDNRKCSIITGYEVYIKRAERTGKLDGWKAWVEGEGKELKAIVEIYRKDMKLPFRHEAYYVECVQLNRDGFPNAVWNKQPRFMTKKVAIGQAFRLCFSDDLGGMPYEEAEMPQEEIVITANEGFDNLPKNKEEPVIQPVSLKQKCYDGMEELKFILLSNYDDGTKIFSDEEYDKVKASLNAIKGAPCEKSIIVISELLDNQKLILHQRIEEHQNKNTAQEFLVQPSLSEAYKQIIEDKDLEIF